MALDGALRVLPIVGDPVAQVRSPAVWNALFPRNGIHAMCVPFHVKPDDLTGFIRGLRAAVNVLGLIVTIPHKAAAAVAAGTLTERARKVGTANLLRPIAGGRWEGDILDGEGFVRALAADGRSPNGLRALVAGAGGVGSAIAFALAEAGAARVDIADIDAARATALTQRLALLARVPASVVAAKGAGYDLIVNASPLGMRADDPMPIDLSGLTGREIVGDVVISAVDTPVLAAAKALGCHTQPGSAMTDHQIAGMAAFMGLTTGDWSPEAVRAAIRAATGG